MFLGSTKKFISSFSLALVLLPAHASLVHAVVPSQNYLVDSDFEGVDPGSIEEWQGWWKVIQEGGIDDQFCDTVDCRERLRTVRRGTAGQRVLELPGLEHCCDVNDEFGDGYSYEGWPCDLNVEQDVLWPWMREPGGCNGCPLEGPFIDVQPTTFQVVELGNKDCLGSHLTLRFNYMAPASPMNGYMYVLHTGIMTHKAGEAADRWQYPGSVSIPASANWRTAELSIDREDDWDAAVVFFRYRYVPCGYTNIYKGQPYPAYCICRCDKACWSPGFEACHYAEVTGVLVDDVYLFEASSPTELETLESPYVELEPEGISRLDEFFPDPRFEIYRPGGQDEIIERLTHVDEPVKRFEQEFFMQLVSKTQTEVCASTCASDDPPDSPCTGDIVEEDRPYRPSTQLESSCVADFNNDGWINGQDLTILLGDWGQKDSIADINCDGAIDGADLTIMLGKWGPCDPAAGLVALPNI